MSKLTIALLVLLVAVLVAAGAFLVTWQIPAPTQPVEKVLPNDQFPK